MCQFTVYETNIGLRLVPYLPFESPSTKPDVDDLLHPLTMPIADAAVDH